MKISKSILFSLVGIAFFSCKEKTNSGKSNFDNNIKKDSAVERIDISEKFEIENFKIEKGKLGPIKVGMTINTAEKNLHNLEKKEAEAYDFGFDGGGKSYIYYFDDKPVLALVPKMNSDIILAIVAISPKFKLENGLHPNARVSDLLKKYPNSKVYQNLMMEWEMMYDYE